ncbi:MULTISPECIES: hypothetical protein [unclassified Microcoleus]|uniref:hypothetical protein n=1 Tax=unclassified Microcoleus TaxID=2642155 RepID=UPI0025EF2381|nr:MULTISPECIES: hypothetical protein [unclassified Microcoleus]
MDDELKQLAVKAQSYPVGSLQRQIALTALMDAIWRSGQLGHPQRGSWKPDAYEDIYSEALLKTFEYIREKIDIYDPERPLMGWVNWLIKRRFSDASEKYMNQRKLEIPSLDDLDIENIPQEMRSNETHEMLRELIQEDPDGVFRSVSVRNRQDITWQDIAKANILDDEKWDSIAQRLGVRRISTINSFYNNNLRKFRDYIRNKLQ